ncbi:Hypothetical predicted protein [Lecanosticta acicola]|uniref:Uncharacterized protein n=1 Tax=Lecanosticta acicola TaxID=111012 RepID=A0AAI8YXI6_9PEZI|nr:Hypothetical predicted protein [Lecanosticta acicola]
MSISLGFRVTFGKTKIPLYKRSPFDSYRCHWTICTTEMRLPPAQADQYRTLIPLGKPEVPADPSILRCRFLELPGEVRNCIYRALFDDLIAPTLSINFDEPWKVRPDYDFSAYINIIRTNRTISKEAQSIFYQEYLRNVRWYFTHVDALHRFKCSVAQISKDPIFVILHCVEQRHLYDRKYSRTPTRLFFSRQARFISFTTVDKMKNYLAFFRSLPPVQPGRSIFHHMSGVVCRLYQEKTIRELVTYSTPPTSDSLLLSWRIWSRGSYFVVHGRMVKSRLADLDWSTYSSHQQQGNLRIE